MTDPSLPPTPGATPTPEGDPASGSEPTSLTQSPGQLPSGPPTHPDLGARIGGDKVAAVRDTGADLACTPNPGCMMQIGAGLRMEGASGEVVHPIELLDQSYQRAGYYT